MGIKSLHTANLILKKTKISSFPYGKEQTSDTAF